MDKITKAAYDALPEEERKYYKPGPKGDDGDETYVLNSGEGAALRERLAERERTIQQQTVELEKFRGELGTLQTTIAGLGDLDELRKAVAEKKKIEAKEYLEKGEVDELRNKWKKEWEADHKTRIEKLQQELGSTTGDLHDHLVTRGLRRRLTSGERVTEDGKTETVPTVMPEYADAAEAVYLSKFKPEVKVEQVNGERRRRVVSHVDGFERDLDSHFPEWWSQNSPRYSRAPQAEGGHEDTVTPGGGPSGSVRQIKSSDHEAISKYNDEIASSKAIVIDG